MSKRDILSGAIPAGLISFILSFIIGGYLLPFPQTHLANAIGNGISGLISGVISVVVTANFVLKKITGSTATNSTRKIDEKANRD